MTWRTCEGSPMFLDKKGLIDIAFYKQNFIDLIVLFKTVFISELTFKDNHELGRAELLLGDDIMLTIRLYKIGEVVSVLVETALAPHYDFLIRRAAEGASFKLVRLMPILELTRDMEAPRD